MEELKRSHKEIRLEGLDGEPITIGCSGENLNITVGGHLFQTTVQAKDLIIEAIEDVCK